MLTLVLDLYVKYWGPAPVSSVLLYTELSFILAPGFSTNGKCDCLQFPGI